MAKDLENMTYSSYLTLDRILTAQEPVSGPPPAHDEMLFIIVHQTYELWFKQILFELDRVQEVLAADVVDDRDLRQVSSSLGRIVEVFKLLIHQLDVLETMTPLDFLDFRNVFRTASGFQSLQFRQIEIRLGLKQEGRVQYDGKSYASFLPEEDQAQLNALAKQGALVDQFSNWLERTPFVEMGGYKFWESYRKAVADMIENDRAAVRASGYFTAETKAIELKKLDDMQARFNTLLDARGDEAQAGWRLSWKALQAALFISLYRDQPVLQGPHSILRQLMDIDELMTLWRYRHSLMAQRMLGTKMGSGGTSGHGYLRETTEKHRVFGDLFALSTFLIPRSKLPRLPQEVEQRMGFIYTVESDAA